jgi:hypothetical protein
VEALPEAAEAAAVTVGQALDGWMEVAVVVNEFLALRCYLPLEGVYTALPVGDAVPMAGHVILVDHPLVVVLEIRLGGISSKI